MGQISNVGAAVPADPLREQQRERLRSLAQAHVVGQDAAEAEPGQEVQPGQATFLVRPQGSGERRSGVGTGVSRSAAWPEMRSPSMPSASTSTSGRSSSPPLDHLLQHLAGGHLAGAPPVDRLERGPQLPVVQLDPLPANPHQRHLQPRQLGQLLGVHHAVADHQVDPEVDQLVEPEAGAGDGSARAARPGGQLETHGLAAGPGRQLHAEPRGLQQRRGLAKELVRFAGVQRHAGRPGRPAAARAVAGTAAPHGPGRRAASRPARCGRPGMPAPAQRSGGRQVEARVLGGLQRELQPPVVAARRAARPAGS